MISLRLLEITLIAYAIISERIPTLELFSIWTSKTRTGTHGPSMFRRTSRSPFSKLSTAQSRILRNNFTPSFSDGLTYQEELDLFKDTHIKTLTSKPSNT